MSRTAPLLVAGCILAAVVRAAEPDEVEVPLGHGFWARILIPVPEPGGAGCFQGWCGLRETDFERMNGQAKGNCTPKATPQPQLEEPTTKPIQQGDPKSMRNTGFRG